MPVLRAAPAPRTLLAVPAASPRFLASAVRSAADALMLDLEDGVEPASKDAARGHLVAFVNDTPPTRPMWVRVNAVDSTDHVADRRALDRVRRGAVAGVVIAKATRASVETAMPGISVPVIALVESARGVEDAADIAAIDGVVGLMFGDLDFRADVYASGGLRFSVSDWARSRVVNAAAAAGVYAIAGPTVETSDAQVVRAEAEHDAALGFAGKLCIHPAQLGAVDAAFRPSSAQLEWAGRVVVAAAAAHDGAFALDGRMIDAPVVAMARGLLAAHDDGTAA